MKSLLYVLGADGKTPVELDGYSDEDFLKWHKCFKDGEKRRVAKTELPNGITIVTVFLGMDYGWGGEPLLFETMVLGPSGNDTRVCHKYSTWDEALNGHNRAVEILKS